MDDNSFSSLAPPSIITINNRKFVNIPVAGVYERYLDSEKYKEYITFNNFCLFRILCQPELPESNGKHVSTAAKELWNYIPQYFKDALQEYCDEVKESKKQDKQRRIYFGKRSYDQSDYNKPSKPKRIRRSGAALKSSKPPQQKPFWVQREELANRRFEEDVNDFVIIQSSPINNFTSSSYSCEINDAKRAAELI